MFKGWKTILAAMLPIVLGFLAQVDWIGFLNNPRAGLAAIGTGVLMLIMRMVTDTPLGKSEHPAELELKKLQENSKTA